MWILNPEWVTAPYEVLIATYDHGYQAFKYSALDNTVIPILFKREIPSAFKPKAARFDLKYGPDREPRLEWVPPVVKSSTGFP